MIAETSIIDCLKDNSRKCRLNARYRSDAPDFIATSCEARSRRAVNDAMDSPVVAAVRRGGMGGRHGGSVDQTETPDSWISTQFGDKSWRTNELGILDDGRPTVS